MFHFSSKFDLLMSIRQDSSVVEIQHKSPGTRSQKCPGRSHTEKWLFGPEQGEFSSWCWRHEHNTPGSSRWSAINTFFFFSRLSLPPHTQPLWKRTTIFRCLYNFTASQVPLQWQQQISDHILTNIFWKQIDHKIQFFAFKNVQSLCVGVVFFSEDVRET